MDLSFFRTLQSMKDMEEKPPFKQKDIKLATFTAKYQDVIIVDQNAAVDEVDHLFYYPGKGTVGKDKLLYTSVPEEEFAVKHGPAQRVEPSLELTTHSITNAMAIIRHYAILRAAMGTPPSAPSWTVILKEGLYIDPPLILFKPPGRKLDDVAVEIVGMKGARILFLRKMVAHNSTMT